MRRTRESLLGEAGQANCYHVVSRVVDRRLVFGDEEKEFFRSLLERQLNFSGLRCLAWCIMGNHFHLLLEVPDKEAEMLRLGEEDLVSRLRLLCSEGHARTMRKQIEMWRENGNREAVDKALDAIRARLFDLSAFMKEFKHKFSLWFNKRHGRRGTLWEERFKSVLVEGRGGDDGPDGLGGLLAVAAYIDLNPVRAGLCDDPKDYRWCSYAEAVAGGRETRAGLIRCVGTEEGHARSWRKASRAYRLVLFGAGERRIGGSAADGVQRQRRGFTQKQLDRVIAAGGRLSLAEVLRCRVRYFTDGAAIGSRAFIRRHGRNEHSDSGGVDLAGGEWGGLSAAGRLRGREIEAPG